MQCTKSRLVNYSGDGVPPVASPVAELTAHYVAHQSIDQATIALTTVGSLEHLSSSVKRRVAETDIQSIRDFSRRFRRHKRRRGHPDRYVVRLVRDL